jgi:hypothetical protein
LKKEKTMKRRITLSIALALSVVLVSLMSSDSTVQAEPPQRFSVDTGFIIPGPHQKVRLTITGFGFADELLRVQFRRITYSPDACSGGICKHIIALNETSDPITVMPGEAAFSDISDGTSNFGVRGIVSSNRRDARVTVMIIDTLTDEVVAFKPADVEASTLGQ